MENIEKDQQTEDLSVDGTTDTELVPKQEEESVEADSPQSATAEESEVAVEEPVEETAEQEGEDVAETADADEEQPTADEEPAEEPVEEEAEQAEEEVTEQETAEQETVAPTVCEDGQKTALTARDGLIFKILGGVGILFAIVVFVRLFAFGLTADAFQYGLTKMNVWETLTAGFGENKFGFNNTIYFSLVLAMYLIPMLVAFGAGVTCLVRSLLLLLADPKEKTKLTVPMIYSAAGIYALISYVVIMYAIAGFCMKDLESCYALFEGALSLAILSGIVSLVQRVIRQATTERVMKEKFYANAEITPDRLVRKKIIKNPTALTALVHKNALFYVTFGVMAAAVIGLLSWLIAAPVAAGVFEGNIKSFMAFFGKYSIDGFMDFLAMVAGICLMISLISSICRLAFRAVDFLGTRLAFGASAQDRYELAKFFGVFWRRLIYTMIFAGAYAALAPEKFELGHIITAVLPYAILMVLCIILRIVYAILANNFKYVTVATEEEEVANDADEQASEQ